MNIPYPEFWEIILAVIYIALGFLIALTVPQGKLRTLFTAGLAVRYLGGLIFLSIYLFYYAGGDTIAYYDTAKAMLNLIFQDPELGLQTYFGPGTYESYMNFNAQSGYPHFYIFKAQDTAVTSKALVPVLLLGFKSYLLTTILISIIVYFGAWRLFLTFRTITGNKKNIATYAILFFPSPIFWGYGVSKDSITFAATCILVHAFYQFSTKHRLGIALTSISALAFLLLFFIKPYVLLVLVPGFTLWYFFNRIKTIKNAFIRTALTPLVILISTLSLGAMLIQFGDTLGDYSMDRILEKAIVTQEDLKKEYYGGNSFDIGTIDPSAIGVISKFPIATFYGFFGPTILQIKNPVSLIAALENTLLLVLFFQVFIMRNPLKTLSEIFDHPFLVFCFAFSLMFAFSIGLTTANFGALVRFKIPLVPFFVFLLLTLYHKVKITD